MKTAHENVRPCRFPENKKEPENLKIKNAKRDKVINFKIAFEVIVAYFE